MSGVNITCGIGNQLGNGGGEMKFEIAPKDNATSFATCIATEIVNDILENALDIATMGGISGLHCDTIAFSVDDGVCGFSTANFNQRINKLDDNTEELNDECPDIKDIIDGLSAIHVPTNNAEEPLHLDVEMKRLLSEMMSPPYDIVNYETLARKDGVGDQPVEESSIETSRCDDDCLVDVEKVKLVEKKTRVTDLVMNSKQVLSEYLMSEESRKQQEEWEEKNERVIQVIELDYVKPEEVKLLKAKTEDSVDNPAEDLNSSYTTEDGEIKEDVMVLPTDDGPMENIDLGSIVKEDNVDKVNEKLYCAGGENFEKNPPRIDKDLSGGSSTSKPNSLDRKVAREICKRKFENFKKKKWSVNLKFWGFGKKKQRDKVEEEEEDCKNVTFDK